MGYLDHLPKIVPGWLRGTWGKRYMRAIGRRLDAVAQFYRDAITARLPGTVNGAAVAPSEALDLIGVERSLPRAPSEADAAYADYLHGAWDAWEGDNTPVTGVGGGGGSHLGMLEAIARLGLPTGTSGVTIVQQNGRYSQLVAGVLTLGTLMNCVNRQNLAGTVPGNLPGWTFEGRDTFWSEFGIVFPANVASLTAGSALAASLNDAVEKWKPGGKLFIGTWVIETGRTLGWPAGARTCGTDPNLGGNVVRYIPPAGGNQIGYYAN
jgi:hypothetical protein